MRRVSRYGFLFVLTAALLASGLGRVAFGAIAFGAGHSAHALHCPFMKARTADHRLPSDHSGDDADCPLCQAGSSPLLFLDVRAAEVSVSIFPHGTSVLGWAITAPQARLDVTQAHQARASPSFV